MQSQSSASQHPANADTTLLLSSPDDGPLSERQVAELRQTWLEHQVNPPGEIESRGVPFSALNE